MNSKTKLKFSYLITFILVTIGILSYTVFPYSPPEDPVRIMLKASAGNVLFDHKSHSSEDGYDISCSDCHHNLEDDDETYSCGECHEETTDDEDVLKRADAFHSSCIACHADNEAGPVECNQCHFMQ